MPSSYCASGLPALTIVNLRARGASEEEIAARNAAIVEEVTRDGRQWISITQTAAGSVIRVMVISYLTEQRHLEMLQKSLTRAARKL